MKNLLIFGCLVSFMFACEIKPVKIDFGRDGCHFCSMTIVDNQHAAEIINDKGKAFKYDAIECMLNDLKSRPANGVGMILINDYNHPGTLISAQEATYLISDAIPSPMGAYLSAGLDHLAVKELQRTAGGEIYTWASIKEKFKVE